MLDTKINTKWIDKETDKAFTFNRNIIGQLNSVDQFENARLHENKSSQTSFF